MKFCSSCGTQMTDDSKFCPGCGKPTEDNSGVNYNQQQSTADMNVNEYSDINYEQGESKLISTVSKQKIVKIISVVAALLVIIAIVVSAAPSLGNTVMDTILPSDKYFKYVIKNSIEDSSTDIGELAGTVKETFSETDKTVAGNVEVIAEDGLYGMLADVSGDNSVSELNWLGKIGATTTVTSKDGDFSTSAEIKLNGKDIASAELVFADNKLYLSFPEFAKSPVIIPANGIDLSKEELQSAQETLNQISYAIPKESLTKELIVKYFVIAFDQIKDVSETKEKVTVNNLSQKYKKLSTEVDQGVLKNAIIAVLEEAKKDEEILKIMKDVCSVEEFDLDYDEIEESYIKEIDSAIENIKESSNESDFSVKIDLYVDSKGNIRGGKISADGFEREVIYIEKGNKFGYSDKIVADGQEGSLEGSGKVSGEKYTGNFKVNFTGVEVLNVELKNADFSKITEGEFSGEMTLQLGSAAKMVSSFISIPKEIFDMKLVIAAKEITTDKSDLKISLYNKDELYASVEVDAATKSGEKIKTPNNAVDVSDMNAANEWASALKTDKFIKNLKNAGVPEKYVNQLEKTFESLE